MTLTEDIKALVDGTPLAVERVAAIWPGLTVTEKASLLPKAMNTRPAFNYSIHRERLIDQALGDDNAYIRYLAAMFVYCPREGATPEEIARYTRIQNDPSPLVRSAETEGNSWKSMGYKPEKFWESPQVWRLAAVTGIKHSGENFAELLLFATQQLIPENKVAEQEMVDVTLQYLTWESMAKRLKETEENAVSSGDGWADYSAGTSLTALWDIIPKVPRQVAFALLQHLPEEGGLAGGVGSNILDALDEHQRSALLYRQDIRLDSWRREQFEKAQDKNLRMAALSNPNFRLDDSVISALVYQPGESQEEGLRKFDELGSLADYYYGASMAQSAAIAKLIKDAPEEISGSRPWSEHYGHALCEMRVKTLDRKTLEREFRDLQLLEMVWGFAPMKEEINERCPAILKAILVNRNPWESFLRLRKARNETPKYTREERDLRASIEENLPRWDFGLPIPEEFYSDPSEEAPSTMDALMRVLPLKLNELGTSIDRIGKLLWGVLAVLALLLLLFRK